MLESANRGVGTRICCLLAGTLLMLAAGGCGEVTSNADAAGATDGASLATDAAGGPADAAPVLPDAEPACESGTHKCSAGCVSDTSPSSCGSSCDPCAEPADGAATCDGVTCGIECNAGYRDMNGSCEPDPNNCGGDGTVCTGGTCSAQGFCTECVRTLGAQQTIYFPPKQYDGISGNPGFELSCRKMPSNVLVDTTVIGTIVASPGSEHRSAFYACLAEAPNVTTAPCDGITNYWYTTFNGTTTLSISAKHTTPASGNAKVHLLNYFCVYEPGSIPCSVTLQGGAEIRVKVAE